MKVFSVVILTAVYCFAIGVVNVLHNNSASQNQKQPVPLQYDLDLSSNLFSHTSQSENSFSNYVKLTVPSLKNTVNPIGAVVKITAQISRATFSQYTYFYRNFLIQYRKADHIFPFHYFW